MPQFTLPQLLLPGRQNTPPVPPKHSPEQQRLQFTEHAKEAKRSNQATEATATSASNSKVPGTLQAEKDEKGFFEKQTCAMNQRVLTVGHIGTLPKTSMDPGRMAH